MKIKTILIVHITGFSFVSTRDTDGDVRYQSKDQMSRISSSSNCLSSFWLDYALPMEHLSLIYANLKNNTLEIENLDTLVETSFDIAMRYQNAELQNDQDDDKLRLFLKNFIEKLGKSPIDNSECKKFSRFNDSKLDFSHLQSDERDEIVESIDVNERKSSSCAQDDNVQDGRSSLTISTLGRVGTKIFPRKKNSEKSQFLGESINEESNEGESIDTGFDPYSESIENLKLGFGVTPNNKKTAKRIQKNYNNLEFGEKLSSSTSYDEVQSRSNYEKRSGASGSNYDYQSGADRSKDDRSITDDISDDKNRVYSTDDDQSGVDDFADDKYRLYHVGDDKSGEVHPDDKKYGLNITDDDHSTDDDLEKDQFTFNNSYHDHSTPDGLSDNQSTKDLTNDDAFRKNESHDDRSHENILNDHQPEEDKLGNDGTIEDDSNYYQLRDSGPNDVQVGEDDSNDAQSAREILIGNQSGENDVNDEKTVKNGTRHNQSGEIESVDSQTIEDDESSGNEIDGDHSLGSDSNYDQAVQYGLNEYQNIENSLNNSQFNSGIGFDQSGVSYLNNSKVTPDNPDYDIVTLDNPDYDRITPPNELNYHERPTSYETSNIKPNYFSKSFDEEIMKKSIQTRNELHAMIPSQSIEFTKKRYQDFLDSWEEKIQLENSEEFKIIISADFVDWQLLRQRYKFLLSNLVAHNPSKYGNECRTYFSKWLHEGIQDEKEYRRLLKHIKKQKLPKENTVDLKACGNFIKRSRMCSKGLIALPPKASSLFTVTILAVVLLNIIQ